MSRLKRRIREAEHFTLNDPILADFSTVKSIAYKVESDDPWVEKLAVSAMADPEYVAMVAHIEFGTEVGEIPKECELANMQSNYNDLSTVTLNGGKTLILKHNSEIMGPKLERANIWSIAHQTHLGQEMMITQLCGKVFCSPSTVISVLKGLAPIMIDFLVDPSGQGSLVQSTQN